MHQWSIYHSIWESVPNHQRNGICMSTLHLWISFDSSPRRHTWICLRWPQYMHCIWHRLKTLRECKAWSVSTKRDSEAKEALNDRWSIMTRCERPLVTEYVEYGPRLTAYQFVMTYSGYWEQKGFLASLRLYVRLTMLLKFAREESRQDIHGHPMWKVKSIANDVQITSR